jgi:hypothetical protein
MHKLSLCCAEVLSSQKSVLKIPASLSHGLPRLPGEMLARLATRQLAADLQWQGIQDAAQKRRRETTRAGAWAGTVVVTDKGVLREFISQEKRARARVEMRWLWDLWQKDRARIPFKPLRST